MKTNFDACMEIIFRNEGGYVNDPHDPGGETNFGISKRAHPKENIRGMTKARAAEIYRAEYWKPIRGDDLPAGLDLVAFDASVNSGVARGAKWLQQAVGANPDGKVGLATIGAAKANYAPAAIMRAIGFRKSFLMQLPTWGQYRTGWTDRLETVEKAALDMAGHEIPVRPDVPPPAPVPAQNDVAWFWRVAMGFFNLFTQKWRH